MTCHRIKNGILCASGYYKVGDPMPDGYMDRFEWAEVHYKSGLRQKRCSFCGDLRFPTEPVCHEHTTIITPEKFTEGDIVKPNGSHGQSKAKSRIYVVDRTITQGADRIVVVRKKRGKQELCFAEDLLELAVSA